MENEFGIEQSKAFAAGLLQGIRIVREYMTDRYAKRNLLSSVPRQMNSLHSRQRNLQQQNLPDSFVERLDFAVFGETMSAVAWSGSGRD